MRRGKQEKSPFELKNGKEKVKPKVKEKGLAGSGQAGKGEKDKTGGRKAGGSLQGLFSSAAAEMGCCRAFGRQG